MRVGAPWYNPCMTQHEDYRAGLVRGLREWMHRQGLTAFVVPSSDPHQGEYVPERFRTRAYISGFSGSAGTVIVTEDHAGLWTDSRYFLEATEAISGTEFVLHRVSEPGVADYPQWLAQTLPRGSSVGVDSRLVTDSWRETVDKTLRNRGITLVASEDPFQALWPDRPTIPAAPVYLLATTQTGETPRSRLQRIRDELRAAAAHSHVITTLDDIAWVLNLRGSDVAYNPVFIAYLVIDVEGNVVLYTDGARLTGEARKSLEQAEVDLRPYTSFDRDLPSLTGPVLLDPERTSWSVAERLRHTVIVPEIQPSTAMKARKNPTELRCLRNAMVRDGVALVRFLAWLDRTVATLDGGTAEPPLDEFHLAEKLRSFRSGYDEYISDSFNYISGLNGNGAIVHYSTPRDGAAALDPPAVYLFDSGAQYRDGTTDITRTVALDRSGGTEVLERFSRIREDFTLVLKGHIALAVLVFPEGKPGRDIDAVARLPLWTTRRNYGHGTGHGVGFVLNVHEGPQKIAPGASDYPLEPGMLCSNEPGLYRPGRYGIRTENLVVVEKAPENEEDEFGSFLRFETLSLCPIDRRLIDTSMLTEAELDWVDAYHRRVREALSDLLDGEDRAWLQRATAPLERDQS